MEKETDKNITELLKVKQCNNLFEFIRLIDINLCNNEDDEFYRGILAKSVIELGKMYIEKDKNQHRILQTTEAAQNYLNSSTEANWDVFFDCSTNSYPFGPGDGCYAVSETGIENCKQGSGCISGAGCLSLNEFPHDLVWKKIKLRLTSELL
jgi:hypothetical protein